MDPVTITAYLAKLLGPTLARVLLAPAATGAQAPPDKKTRLKPAVAQATWSHR